MKELLVGCPVARREWIIDQWWDKVEEACRVADVVPEFVFAADGGDPTVDLLMELSEKSTHAIHFVWVDDPTPPTAREWNADRYHRMVELRNQLITKVRELAPPLFLSLDSDILLHPRAIEGMLEGLEYYDLVGSKTYMTSSGTQFPSYAMLNVSGTGLHRPDADTLMAVDVVMAIKLMTPKAYVIDYVWDSRGEDVGFCRVAKSEKLRVGWDGRYASRHVIEPKYLNTTDRRYPDV